MSLKIYNSLTKKKEEFKPLKEGEVKIYVCGPTVYDEPHIGHLRSAYVFEMMRNYFIRHYHYKVIFVRNVTDVDDKIIQKAKDLNMPLGQGVKKISKLYHKLYTNELKRLGIKKPTEEPKATEHIEDMRQLIKKLIEKGFAYKTNGDVYFSVNSFKEYGKLSGQKKEAMLEGARKELDENKRDPLDFALWKKAKEGEPSWDSPWGNGRPGWHIECSAMSMRYLGEYFDIHGGGRDLVFPHHENEIAQSESATNERFAKCWIHHGLITVNGHKMSKSLRNYITLKNLIDQDSRIGEKLKFLFLGTHYSMPLDYSEEKIKMEESIRGKFINFLMTAEGFRNAINKKDIAKSRKELKRYKDRFFMAMDNDFNTPLTLTVMHELVSLANSSDLMSAKVVVADLLKSMFRKLGLSYSDAYPKLNDYAQSFSYNLDQLISQRMQARLRKDFSTADNLKQEIIVFCEKNGYKVEFLDHQDTSETRVTKK